MKRDGSVFLRKKFNSMFLAYLATWSITTVGDMADCILAGIFLNADAVSAVELVLPVFSIIMFLCSFAAVGASTLFSRAMGEFDTETACRVNGTGLLFALGSGVVIALGLWGFKDAFFRFYESAPAVELLAREYYDCVIPIALLYPVYWLIYYLIVNDGNAGLCVIVDVVNVVVNAAASILLVGKLGVRGLGCGTILSVIVSGIVMCSHFLNEKSSLKFRLCFDLRLFGKISALGSAMSMTYLYVGIVDMIVNRFIIRTFGSVYLAPYAVINLMLNLCGCLTSPMSAASPFVSVSFGEKNPTGIKKAMDLVGGGMLKVCIGFILVFEALAAQIPGWYGITAPELAAYTVYAVRLIPLSYFATALVMTLSVYLPKIDRVLLGNLISLVYMLVTPLIFPLWFSRLWGYHGLIWGFFVTPIASLFLYFLYVWGRYGIRRFPYLIPDTDDTIFIHELAISEQTVAALNDAIAEELTALAISSEIIHRVQLVLEESFLIVRDKNNGKRILADCTVIVGGEYLRVITRDNGILFDITDENAEIRSLRDYMNAQLNASGLDSRYLKTTSFNRNSYFWKLSEEGTR